jgi:cation diffusion facilitator family transporter
MHTDSIDQWQHSHVFGQDEVRYGEKRTLIVVVITAVMTVVEVLVGIFFGSMALLADGIHMGSHMVGLLITMIAYVYARKYARDESFSFGTGKVNSLAGYTSAILLTLFALLMGWESVKRFLNPIEIQFNVAIAVAFIGLIVNGASIFILGEAGHTRDDNNGHDYHDHADQNQDSHAHRKSGSDHNLKAAYLHVSADAVTSVLAILALLAAKYFGWIWADPLMGLAGAVLVAHWSFGLIRATSNVLLDRQSSNDIRDRIVHIFESDKDTRVTDLHLWCIGPGIYNANLSLVTRSPVSPEKYKALIPKDTGIVHATVEVHQCTN